jgi:hypothetical protein
MFFVHVLIFIGTDGVGSRFHVLRSRARFRRCGGRHVPFSSFALPDSFFAVPRASGPVFMFWESKLVFGGTEGVGSRFYILRSQTSFWRCGGRRVPFSCFSRSYLFSVVPRASGPVFMFCAPGLIFGGTGGVGTRFSCFAHPDLFSTEPRASSPMFMFCVP